MFPFIYIVGEDENPAFGFRRGCARHCRMHHHATTVRNYSFSNIHVTNCPRLVDAKDISPRKPLAGFSLANVTGTCTNGIALANITGAKLRNINVAGYLCSLITKTNVQVLD